MTIKVLINGAKGRMGLACVKVIEDDVRFSLVGCPEKNSDLILEIQRSHCDVVIDFTNAAVVFDNAKKIIAADARPVIGTSGLKTDQIELLQNECRAKKLGGIVAPNFSLGAVLLMKYSREIVKYFPDVEIIETHHTGKLDSPSGTSMRTAEMLAENRQTILAKKPLHENVVGARGALYQDIPIHSIRLPGYIAYEQVIFGAVGESLTLTHNSIDRACFMPGVILACEKVMGLQEMVYGLERIL